jgi:hypothetical protein
MSLIMYENKEQPLAPVKVYYSRLLRNMLIAMGILSFCLLLGVFGYHYTADIPWIDALHNASMILSGMGPVVAISNFSGKLFSSAYALFSGVVFITNIGFILAPAIHRLFHKLHMDDGPDDGAE